MRQTYLDISAEERKKILDLDFFNIFIVDEVKKQVSDCLENLAKNGHIDPKESTQDELIIVVNKVIKEFDEMDTESKNLLTCDEVLALYLRIICLKVNAKFYIIVLKFVILFRDCLNEFGWHKRRENIQILK